MPPRSSAGTAAFEGLEETRIRHPADDPLKTPLPGPRFFLTGQADNSAIARADWTISCDDRFKQIEQLQKPRFKIRVK